jgi:glucose-1-phosphate cytidylyltransferase
MLWHIMKIYDHWGYHDFCVALGYKGDYIKRWFRDYYTVGSSMTVNTRSGKVIDYPDASRPEWNIDLVETGEKTMTGGRIKRLAPWLGDDTALVTWGDGVADINIPRLLEFHRAHGKLATMTAVRPPARYGHLELKGDRITHFTEKPQIGEGWINGAFFVLEPAVLDYIEGDDVMFEHAPLSRLAEDGQLMAYRHESFWQCMDTMREKQLLTSYWQSGHAPWKLWSE